MKLIFTSILACTLLGTCLSFAQQPIQCPCKNCKCTPQKHCGCFSNQGCTCGEHQSCGSDCNCKKP